MMQGNGDVTGDSENPIQAE